MQTIIDTLNGDIGYPSILFVLPIITSLKHSHVRNTWHMNLDYSLFVSEKREMRKNRENYTRMQERNGQKGERERERERN